MVIARSCGADGQEFLLLGLSRANIDRLQAGQPIRISRGSHGTAVPEHLTISIITGGTELEIYEGLKAKGLIDECTVGESVEARVTTVAAFWERYRREVLPVTAPAIQVQECRRAFYAGVKAMLAVLLEIGDDAVSEDEGVELIERLHEECRVLVADVLEGRA
jgi:hypothetical protein